MSNFVVFSLRVHPNKRARVTPVNNENRAVICNNMRNGARYDVAFVLVPYALSIGIAQIPLGPVPRNFLADLLATLPTSS